MMRRAELTIGITSWNSELFLPHCIHSVRKTTPDIDVRIAVVDNESTDGSVRAARELGVDPIVRQCSQGDALNLLLERSPSRYTLLVHSDVVLLSPQWYSLCCGKIAGNVVLVSPEDIGCGPYSRPFGAGKPESSFLFFDTEPFRRTAALLWSRWHRIPYPRVRADFYGEHVTHNLPERLRRKGYAWYPMDVHLSDEVAPPIYEPAFRPGIWTEELGRLRYGLGNFYSIEGTITHYHNWYDRIDRNVDATCTRTSAPDGRGFPLAYIKAYTEAFLRDYSAGRVVLPVPAKPDRQPVGL